MDEERRIEELLEAISNDEKYKESVFKGPGIYFVIGNGTLWEISDDASCSPKGGWFPDIVTGITEEEKNCIDKMMGTIGFSLDFFGDLINDCGEFDDEYALEYFEDNEDEESAKIYRKMKRQVKNGKTSFATMDDFVSALGRYELDGNTLYYEWEGEFIEFHDNIAWTGETRGSYENLSNSQWIEILTNIDNHIVTAD